MARSKKIPIDYFNLSVHFWDEIGTKKLIRKYGTDGVIVYLKLTAEVFKNSFYLPFDKEDFELFSFELNMETDKFLEILDYLMKLDFFDKQIFERYKVITSKEIQDQYFAVKRRNKAKLILSDFEKKLLISDEENTNLQGNFEKTDDIQTEKQQLTTEITESQVFNNTISEGNNETQEQTLNEKRSNSRKTDENVFTTSTKADGNSQNSDQIFSSIPTNSDGISQNSASRVKKSKVKKSKERELKEKKSSVGISDGNEENSLSLTKKDFERLRKEIIPKFAEKLRPAEGSEEEKKWAQAYKELLKNLTPEEIDRLITFGLEDEFWRKNFHALYFLTKPARADGVPIWRKMYTQMQNNSHQTPSVNVDLSNLKML